MEMAKLGAKRISRACQEQIGTTYGVMCGTSHIVVTRRNFFSSLLRIGRVGSLRIRIVMGLSCRFSRQVFCGVSAPLVAEEYE
jgi:hypothetical protein